MDKQDKLLNFVKNSQGLLNNLHSANFIKSLDSLFMACNVGAENMLRVTAKNVVRRSDYDFPWENHADLYRQHDQDAIKNGFSDVLEPVQVSNKVTLVLRTMKHPIRDENQEIIGIFAQMTIVSENKSLTEAISFVNNHDEKMVGQQHDYFPTAYHIGRYDIKLKLTSREIECLFLIIRGKSSKEIGKFLSLSPRTIEVYIENIKQKMGVSSRTEIIDKAIDFNLLKIIPTNTVVSLMKNPEKWQEFFKK